MNEDTIGVGGMESQVEMSAGGGGTTEAGIPPCLLSLSPTTKGGDDDGCEGTVSLGLEGSGEVSLKFSNQLDSNISTTASTTVTTNKGKGQC